MDLPFVPTADVAFIVHHTSTRSGMTKARSKERKLTKKDMLCKLKQRQKRKHEVLPCTPM
jgi:hypothetical protein